MNTATESKEPKTARQWLDAFSAGACSSEALLRGLTSMPELAGDANWEVVSLLDQYYRRGKLKPEVFEPLKTHFQKIALRDDLNRTAAGHLAPPPPAARAAVPAAPPPAVPSAPAAALAGADGEGLLNARYRLQTVLGRGPAGTVYEALDERRLDLPGSGRRIALKQLGPAATRHPAALEELHRDFQYLQSLSHPCIVRVFDFDRAGDSAFYTMELLEGASLGSMLRQRTGVPVDRPRARAIIRAIGQALEYAHARGILHGNLGPRSVFLTRDGEVRLLSFGAAHFAAQNQSGNDDQAPQDLPVDATAYASCEVLEGQAGDERDDIYAAAGVAYLLLSGEHPFQNHTALQARTLGLHPRRPAGLTQRSWQALEAALSFDRDRRPRSIQEWLRDFDAAEPQRHTLASQPNAAITVVILVLALMGAIFAIRLQQRQPVPAAVSMAPNAATASAAGAASSPSAAVNAPKSATAPKAPPAPKSAAAGKPAPAAAASAPAMAATGAAPAPTSAPAPSAAPAPTSAPVPSAAPAAAGGAGSDPLANLPAARIDFTTELVEVRHGDAFAKIDVRRRGYMRSDVTFTWGTEPGTAHAGTDFAPVKAQVEHMAAQKGRVSLFVPLISGAPGGETRNFYVILDETGPGAILGERTVTMVSIVSPD